MSHFRPKRYVITNLYFQKVFDRGEDDNINVHGEEDFSRTLNELFAKTASNPNGKESSADDELEAGQKKDLFPDNIDILIQSGNYRKPKFLGINPLIPAPESEIRECN